jgi:hypothetical protein
MKRRTIAAAFAAIALGSVLAACSGGSGSAKTADITPADMPEGADWTGVYFDPGMGYFHLIQEGKTVAGKWERPHKERWGEVHGEATGNVVKFTWTEYTRGAVGKNAELSGRGYFVYTRPAGENVDDKVDGEMGIDKDEVGTKLSLVKQRNVKPDPETIGGAGASDLGGGDWDSENKEKGTPEPPSPP